MATPPSLVDNSLIDFNENNEHFSSFPSSSASIVANEVSSNRDQCSSSQEDQSIKSSSSILSNETRYPDEKLFQRANSVYFVFFSISYGVDWSPNVNPSSHCWFPLVGADSSCTNQESSDEATMLQCGSCALIAHSHHSKNLIKSCRPSFSDENDHSPKSNEHFWSYISALSVPCARCQRSSIMNSLFGSDCISSPSQILDQVTTMINSISDKSSDGLVCLWCSRGYHRSCWEKLSNDEKIQCDYGLFR